MVSLIDYDKPIIGSVLCLKMDEDIAYCFMLHGNNYRFAFKYTICVLRNRIETGNRATERVLLAAYSGMGKTIIRMIIVVLLLVVGEPAPAFVRCV